MDVERLLSEAFGEPIHIGAEDYLGKVIAGCLCHQPCMSGDQRDRLDPKQRRAVDDTARILAAALAQLQAERDEAREALRPFAEASRDCDDDLVSDGCSAWESSEANCVTIGHFRAASRALGGGE